MILGYLNKKFEQEYHHLSLWYFVGFISGIILFFQLFPVKSLYVLALSAACCVVLSLYFYKRNLIIYFLSFCILSILLGMIAANIRLYSIETQPIKKTMITTLVGEVESLKPTLRGVQVLMRNNKGDNDRYFNKVRVNISNKLSSKLSPGDVISLKVKLFPLQSSVLPGAYDFGFYMYMSGIEASGYALTAPEIMSNNISEFAKYIKLKRRQIYKRLLEVLGKEEGNFAAAILIGETKAIP